MLDQYGDDDRYDRIDEDEYREALAERSQAAKRARLEYLSQYAPPEQAADAYCSLADLEDKEDEAEEDSNLNEFSLRQQQSGQFTIRKSASSINCNNVS